MPRRLCVGVTGALASLCIAASADALPAVYAGHTNDSGPVVSTAMGIHWPDAGLGCARRFAERPSSRPRMPGCGATARAAISHGSSVGAGDAPWSVLLLMTIDPNSPTVMACSGSIIDATHVLTAAHCTYQDDGTQQWPVSAYEVNAGITDANPGADYSQLQQRSVLAVRIHPGFTMDPAQKPSPDDVAVLTVGPPFHLSGAVGSVAPVGAGQSPAPGAALTVVGWGDDAPGISDAREYKLATAVAPDFCGDGLLAGFPSLVCATSPVGDICPGDSGSGAVLPGSPPRLAAVTSFSSRSCTSGDDAGFVDLASPEIATWLAGSDSPVAAPRATDFAAIFGGRSVGAIVTCTPPRWSGAPETTSFRFVEVPSLAVVQDGPPSYRLRDSDRGHHIGCISIATNAGGTTSAHSRTVTQAVIAPIKPRLAIRLTKSGLLIAGDVDPVGVTLHLTVTHGGRLYYRASYRDDRVKAAERRLPRGSYRVCLASDPKPGYERASRCVRVTRR